MIRIIGTLFGLAALVLAAPAGAHQKTVAYSRVQMRASGEVDYALKIPVEDLAEPLGREGHARLDAPEVRAAEEQLFRHFSPLVSMSSGGVACRRERNGIFVPEDERLYGELRFVFHCPAGAPVTLDYQVFFAVDPAHVGMLVVEGPLGKARAELIVERPRWEITPSTHGPPDVRAVDGALTPASRSARPTAQSTFAEPPRSLRRYWAIGALVVAVAGAGGIHAVRVARRRGRISRS